MSSPCGTERRTVAPISSAAAVRSPGRLAEIADAGASSAFISTHLIRRPREKFAGLYRFGCSRCPNGRHLRLSRPGLRRSGRTFCRMWAEARVRRKPHSPQRTTAKPRSSREEVLIFTISFLMSRGIPTVWSVLSAQGPAFPQPELPEGFKPSRRRLRKCVRKRRTALQQNLPLWRARREAPSEPHRRGDRSACIQSSRPKASAKRSAQNPVFVSIIRKSGRPKTMSPPTSERRIKRGERQTPPKRKDGSKLYVARSPSFR